MYTVVVIDGRANGLPILDSPVLLTDRSGRCQSPRAKSRMATFQYKTTDHYLGCKQLSAEPSTTVSLSNRNHGVEADNTSAGLLHVTPKLQP